MGAVCPQTGQCAGLLAPHMNTEIVNLFLEQFARELSPGVHAVLIWDQAGFHTAKALQVPANISLIVLPPYSPELNPVENLWHYLRSHHWANRNYEDYDDLLHAANDAWQKTCLQPELIQSVCATPYSQRAVN
jgi:transposase